VRIWVTAWRRVVRPNPPALTRLVRKSSTHPIGGKSPRHSKGKIQRLLSPPGASLRIRANPPMYPFHGRRGGTQPAHVPLLRPSRGYPTRTCTPSTAVEEVPNPHMHPFYGRRGGTQPAHVPLLRPSRRYLEPSARSEYRDRTGPTTTEKTTESTEGTEGMGGWCGGSTRGSRLTQGPRSQNSGRSWFSVDCAFGFVVLRGLQPAELASVHSGSPSVFSAPS
jgi:hypothetical protein